MLSFLAILLMSEELEWALADIVVARAARIASSSSYRNPQQSSSKSYCGEIIMHSLPEQLSFRMVPATGLDTIGMRMQG